MRSRDLGMSRPSPAAPSRRPVNEHSPAVDSSVVIRKHLAVRSGTDAPHGLCSSASHVRLVEPMGRGVSLRRSPSRSFSKRAGGAHCGGESRGGTLLARRAPDPRYGRDRLPRRRSRLRTQRSLARRPDMLRREFLNKLPFAPVPFEALITIAREDRRGGWQTGPTCPRTRAGATRGRLFADLPRTGASTRQATRADSRFVAGSVIDKTDPTQYMHCSELSVQIAPDVRCTTDRCRGRRGNSVSLALSVPSSPRPVRVPHARTQRARRPTWPGSPESGASRGKGQS
jgi:hypothetical protein